jgi:hypothetical protein
MTPVCMEEMFTVGKCNRFFLSRIYTMYRGVRLETICIINKKHRCCTSHIFP